MIFNLDGRIEEMLALTPVIRGWKEFGGEKLLLNVLYPDLFKDNPFVDGFMQSEGEKNDALVNFNQVIWQTTLKPVCEQFMEFVLGKQKPSCWQTLMLHTKEDGVKADAFVRGGKVAVISMKDVPVGLMESLAKKEYLVVRLTHKDCLSLQVFRAAVDRASLYIGDDGDDTAIAMTTNVPAVVCYTWRSPTYFAPFRCGIPFETIAPRKIDCLYADGCLMSNGLFEMGRTYGVKCQMPEKTVCKKSVTLERIMEAVERIEAKA